MLKLCEDYALKHKIILKSTSLFPINHSQSAKRLYVKIKELAGHPIY